jgi:spore germination protein PE
MLRRISSVDRLRILSVQFSSVVEVGDSNQIKPTSKALAVQREFPIFFGNEGAFKQYPIFEIELPSISSEQTVPMKIKNENPIIQVGTVRIVGVSNSSVFQIGSTNTINAEARVKHFRQIRGN